MQNTKQINANAQYIHAQRATRNAQALLAASASAQMRVQAMQLLVQAQKASMQAQCLRLQYV
jgi:hypothetical protein